jgi:hypothetical protein
MQYLEAGQRHPGVCIAWLWFTGLLTDGGLDHVSGAVKVRKVRFNSKHTYTMMLIRTS